jgi:ssDNA-binding Zn-finger/Zn-ribbon topoisomerase 1
VTIEVAEDEWEIAAEWTKVVECPSCGSPNRVRAWRRRQGKIEAMADSGYE